MKIKRIYIEEELECWQYIAEFLELDTEKEMDNDFEKTKDLFTKNHKEIYQNENENIYIYILSYNNKTMLILEDLEEEISYFINI